EIITTKLVTSLAKNSNTSYRTAVVDALLQLHQRDGYSLVMDFEAYVAMLVELVYVSGVDVGDKLRDAWMDVAVRVQSLREFNVKQAVIVVFLYFLNYWFEI